MKALKNEILILKKLTHERIVSYHGSEQKKWSSSFVYGFHGWDESLHLLWMSGSSLEAQKKAKIDKRRGISTKMKIERSLHSKVHQNDNFLTACHKIKFDELYMIHFNSCNPDPSNIFPFRHCHLYHAIENTAN